MIKEKSEWDASEIKMAQLNAKAMHTLFCALEANEYTGCPYVKMPWKFGTSFM